MRVSNSVVTEHHVLCIRDQLSTIEKHCCMRLDAMGQTCNALTAQELLNLSLGRAVAIWLRQSLLA